MELQVTTIYGGKSDRIPKKWGIIRINSDRHRETLHQVSSGSASLPIDSICVGEIPMAVLCRRKQRRKQKEGTQDPDKSDGSFIQATAASDTTQIRHAGEQTSPQVACAVGQTQRWDRAADRAWQQSRSAVVRFRGRADEGSEEPQGRVREFQRRTHPEG